MEIRDLYDENKKLTGETIYKTDKVPTGRYYLTVVVFIQNNKNEFLIQKNMKYNLWSTTGGHPVSGESSLEGIVTEIKEELGVTVDKNKLCLVDTIKTEDDFIDIYYLKLNINIKEIIMQENEVSDVMWVSKNKLDEIINNKQFLPPHIEFYNSCCKSDLIV